MQGSCVGLCGYVHMSAGEFHWYRRTKVQRKVGRKPHVLLCVIVYIRGWVSFIGRRSQRAEDGGVQGARLVCYSV